MELSEGVSEGDWSSMSSMYAAEEADFMAQLLTNSCVPTENEQSLAFGIQSLWPSQESTLTNGIGNNRFSYYSTHVGESTNLSSFKQGTSSSGSFEDYCFFSDNKTALLTDNGISSYIVDGNEDSVEEPDLDYQEKPVLLDENCKPIADFEKPVLEDSAENKSKKERSTKRARPSIEIPKCKRNVKSRKTHKDFPSNSEEENAGIGRKNSSNIGSEDEPNAFQDGGSSSSLSPTEAAPTNLNVKTRASRGAATDPQSLYARKRRERINERLRILQTLVPNGTKVDMSTMLEEAVQYVKFLQLQIKLLSSDDLWMYAPIAYNGMNVGLDLKIIPPTKLP